MTSQTVKRLSRLNTTRKRALETALKKDPMARILITVHTHAVADGHLVASVFREEPDQYAYLLGEKVSGIRVFHVANIANFVATACRNRLGLYVSEPFR